MRFETSKSVPPHLNRRLQLRMMGFVGLIGVIMFFMGTLQPKQKPKGKDQPLPGSPDAPWFQVEKGDRPELKDGEFISTPNPRQPGDPNDPAEGWKEPPPLDQPPPVDPELEQELARREVKFNKSILRRVKDNTIGIRRDEADAYYRLLYHARKVPIDELELAGATDVQYINLMTEPDRFRGEPVTIHGDLWRLYEFEAGPNTLGLKALYEAWIFTSDSEKNPYRVIFTTLPKELEPGVNLRKQVRVTGYFFKREGYASSGGMHVAPTLLAQRIIPFRPPGAPPSTDAIVPYMMVVIAAIGLAFLVTLVGFTISDRRAARVALLRELNAPPPSFAGINAGPMPTVQESLRQMEELEWQALESTVDAEHGDASAALHARDRAAAAKGVSAANGNSANRASGGATHEKSTGSLHDQARTVQAWTNQQHGSTGKNGSINGIGHAPDSSALERERRDADRVLNSLAKPTGLTPAPPTSAGPTSEASTATGSTGSPSDPSVVDPGDAEVVGLGDADVVSGDARSLSDPVSGGESGTGPDSPAAANGPSKLAAWENEVQQFAKRGRNRDDLPTPEEQAVQEELDRDQAAREQELQDRLQHQRTELEAEQKLRAAREREQAEQDRRESDQRTSHPRESGAREDRADIGRSPASPDHLTIDRADRVDHRHGTHPEADAAPPDADDDAGSDDSADWARRAGRRRRRDGR